VPRLAGDVQTRSEDETRRMREPKPRESESADHGGEGVLLHEEVLN
jgi:hypothetical protein